MTVLAADGSATSPTMTQAPSLDFIDYGHARYPKVSLHEHLLWSLSTFQVLKLANENGQRVPSNRIMGDHFEFKDMADMFLAHDQIRPAITREAKDYGSALSHWLAFQANKGVIYCEFMFSTQPHANDPDFYARQIDEMAIAIEQAQARYGIQARGIINGIRHHGLDANHYMLDQVERNHGREASRFITGYGLSGDESLHPPEKFRGLFERAVDLGLQCTIHSGEVLGPDSIRQALQLPGVKRLGHGIRAVEDSELVEEIKQRGIVLEICPTSNMALLPQYRNPTRKGKQQYEDYTCHPMSELLKRGVKIVLGADDGPWFRTSISREYRRVAKAFNLSLERTLQFTENGIAAAFVDETTRAAIMETYYQQLKAYGDSCFELRRKMLTTSSEVADLLSRRRGSR